MNSDKARDDQFFSCSQPHEIKYVSGRYENAAEVAAFLREKCESGAIKYSSHDEVYKLIEDELGFPIPLID